MSSIKEFFNARFTKSPRGPWTVEFFTTWALIALIETLRCTLHIQILSMLKFWLSERPFESMRTFFIHWIFWILLTGIFYLLGLMDLEKIRSQSPADFDGMSLQVIFLAVGFYFNVVVFMLYLIIVSLTDSFFTLVWGEEEASRKIWNLLSTVAIIATIYAFFAAHLERREKYFYNEQRRVADYL